MTINPEIGTATSPRAAEVEPQAPVVPTGGSADTFFDDVCEGGIHCCCGLGEACCDCGLIMPAWRPVR